MNTISKFTLITNNDNGDRFFVSEGANDVHFAPPKGPHGNAGFYAIVDNSGTIQKLIMKAGVCPVCYPVQHTDIEYNVTDMIDCCEECKYKFDQRFSEYDVNWDMAMDAYNKLQKFCDNMKPAWDALIVIR